MKTSEEQFAVSLQRRLFQLMGFEPESWDKIDGVMLSKDMDTQLIHIEIVTFGSQSQHFILSREHQN